ncbi:MAG TPA: response regulator [Planctomycetota bacterium]|nr:response regulator [Planctomycetota bacterium]
MDPEPTVGELPEPASQPQRLRVLIADDERDTLVTLGLLCRDEGMEVRLVKWGEQVPAAVAEFGPDVVLLDLAMPDRGGLDIAEELINRYGERGPVLIALTAYASESDRKMAKEAGFHDFIAKPYDPPTLLRRLAAIKPR